MKPSLLVSILRRTKNNEEKFREIQAGWFFRLKQRMWLVGSILLVGYAVYWIQTMPAAAEPDTTQQIKKVETGKILDKRNDLSTSDLILMASEMEFDSDAPLPVIMEFLKNRLEIADQLLAKTDDEFAQKEGTLFRIEAMQTLSKLNRTHAMGYSTLDQQLYELCSANLSHRNSEVAKVAAAAIMFTSFDEFTYEPTSANLNNALSKCNQIASQLGDDVEIARAIYVYGTFKKRSLVTVDDSTEFFNVVIKHFRESANPEAKSYADSAYKEIVFGSDSADEKSAVLLTEGIKDRIRQKRRSADNELNRRIRYGLRTDFFDERALNQIMRLMEIFPTVGRIEAGSEMAADVAEFVANLPDEQLKTSAERKINDFQARMGRFEKTLAWDDFATVANSEQDWLRLENTLVLFWAATDKRSEGYLRTLDNLGIQRVLQCIVVVASHDDASIQLARKLDKEMPGFTFVTANKSSGIQSPVDFPVSELPYLLLLNDQLQVSSMNPDLRQLGPTIKQLLQ